LTIVQRIAILGNNRIDPRISFGRRRRRKIFFFGAQFASRTLICCRNVQTLPQALPAPMRSTTIQPLNLTDPSNLLRWRMRRSDGWMPALLGGTRRRCLRFARPLHLLALLGIGDNAELRRTSLSGGQRSAWRIALRRARTNRPCCFADAPNRRARLRRLHEILSSFRRLHAGGQTISSAPRTNRSPTPPSASSACAYGRVVDPGSRGLPTRPQRPSRG